MKAYVLVKNGAPDRAFELQDLPSPEPGPGQVRISVDTFGLNFADVMARKGLYQDCPPLPTVLGYEVVGIVDKVGSGVENLAEGDRVLGFTRFGGYAKEVVTDARGVVKLPDSIDDAAGTALGVQYSTAWFCAEERAKLNPGDHVLIQAAAGGVGTALCQMAKRRGAIVYGTAGSDKKLDYLRSLGVDHPINYRKQDFAKVIQKLGGAGKLDAAFDSIGGEVYSKSYALLGKGGVIVSYGIAGRVGGGPFALAGMLWKFGLLSPVQLLLDSKGRIGVNMLHIADEKPDILERCLTSVVDLTAKGELKPTVGKIFPSSQLGEAHNFLEGRGSIGKIAVEWE